MPKQEALIRLAPDGTADFDGVLTALEGEGVRVLNAWRPTAIMASIDPDSADRIASLDGVASVETTAVPSSQLEAAGQTERTVLEAWNDRLNRTPRSADDPTRGLSWDSPGFLPPDPPAEVREELRRRERKLDQNE